jgi:GMP synthase-like glutamine amidotransferase
VAEVHPAAASSSCLAESWAALDRLPTGFTQLARGYLSEIQMMVRRTSEQLIYGVQFHIEKSFQDWQQDNYWSTATRAATDD